jgi:trans-aconitate methyltransferase
MTLPHAPTQEWNAKRYAVNAHFVPALGQPLLELLNPQPGERILDLACGDGVLSEKIAATGATVLGVDSSADMVQAAIERGIDARTMDAYQLSFDLSFDAVLCNAALHWMKRDPDAVIAGVNRALKSGGRFVAEMGGHGNVAAIHVALLAVLAGHGVQNSSATDPWFFPTVNEYRARLERGGFHVEYIELIPRPTPLPTGMQGWLQTFGMPFLQLLPSEERNDGLKEVVEMLRPALCDGEGNWTADYVRLRFLARKG